MKPCRCTPPVEDPRFRAHLATHGICLFSVGHTTQEAIRNLALHAQKDRIPRYLWTEAWVENMRGLLLREVELGELQEALA